jgi:hypothetical protein
VNRTFSSVHHEHMSIQRAACIVLEDAPTPSSALLADALAGPAARARGIDGPYALACWRLIGQHTYRVDAR